MEGCGQVEMESLYHYCAVKRMVSKRVHVLVFITFRAFRSPGVVGLELVLRTSSDLQCAQIPIFFLDDLRIICPDIVEKQMIALLILIESELYPENQSI